MLYYVPYMIVSLLYTVIVPYVCVLRFHVVKWNSKADLHSEDNIIDSDEHSIDIPSNETYFNEITTE